VRSFRDHCLYVALVNEANRCVLRWWIVEVPISTRYMLPQVQMGVCSKSLFAIISGIISLTQVT